MNSKLKEFRAQLNLQQKEFAEILGINKNTYNNYENGNREPSADFWITISKKFSVSVDYLMGLSEIKEIYNPSPTSVDDFADKEMHRIIEKLPKLKKDQLESIEKRIDIFIDDNEVEAREVFFQPTKKAT